MVVRISFKYNKRDVCLLTDTCLICLRDDAACLIVLQDKVIGEMPVV